MTTQPPRDVWLIARTSRLAPYPCRCRLDRRCQLRCWCNGRTDHGNVPDHCCAKPKETRHAASA